MQIDGIALDSRSLFVFQAPLTPAPTPAARAVEQAFTMPTSAPKLKSTDAVLVSGPGSSNDVTITNSRINSSGQLVIQFSNTTAGALTHAAGTFNVVIIRA
jgi:hypothetical protein